MLKERFMNTPSEHEPPTPPPKPPEPPEPDPPPADGTPNDRNIALVTHLSGFIFSIIVPLIVWLMHRDRSDKAYLVEESREALNFQITVLIGYFICWILTVLVIGAFLMWLLWIANLVFCIIAAVKLSSGEPYRYPVNLRLIR